MTDTAEISILDKKIIRLLQGEFPLVAEPYKILAEKIGITEEELLARITAMREEKKIRKVGAVLRHREVGFTANALCVWDVPDAQMDEVARRMAEHPRVSHCYDRNRSEDWRYNLYTMIHGYSRDECEEIAAVLAAETGIAERRMLYTKHEWKKTSMKYFTEDE
ncbi:nitrite reductase heme biosynthesis H family protein [Selenomonas sp. FOBRC9]|jgi:nitrite reductase heme biosynthesis H protein|uniref:siroheme decarboxylase subunit beta n=1 Tax=Selenomonas sp. FOBRC9 TaxID=936573 RepID=UPI00027A5448|nr:Lrp/AsnC family transcriptional regulator [Selenomonas sp. FOBRC9]EJP34076.1 nitrite reductase heme biosynthesis H family protein [Selenomonas sp. FOBRC9]